MPAPEKGWDDAARTSKDGENNIAGTVTVNTSKIFNFQDGDC